MPVRVSAYRTDACPDLMKIIAVLGNWKYPEPT